MKSIFDKVNISGLTISNRVAAAAVGRNLADIDGHIPVQLYDIYSDLADGGVGLIISEMTMVSRSDYPVPGFTRLQDDEVIDEYKKLTNMVHEKNVKIVVQLAYGGFFRDDKMLTPDELTIAELEQVKQEFIEASDRAKKAGFDGLELHCAHGFLLNKVISPAFNHRTDEYGGSIENQCRLTVEIIKGIRDKCGSFPIFAKINSSDGQPDGITEDESITVCRLLEKTGIDAIEVSGMNATVTKIKPGQNEGYYSPFSTKLKKAVFIPVILTGGHRSIENMEMLLNDDSCDMFSIARPLIREPAMIARWQGGNTKPSDCVSCNMCVNTDGHKCIRGTINKDGTVTKNQRK